MQNKSNFKKLLLCASVAMASSAQAVVPTDESEVTGIAIAVTGTINEIISCSFGGAATGGLNFLFDEDDPNEDQYTVESAETLEINCANGGDGRQYAIEMTVEDGGTEADADFGDRASELNLDVGATPTQADPAVFEGGVTKQAILSAKSGTGSFQPVSDSFAPIASGSSETYTFQLAIVDPASETGRVVHKDNPNLYVKFDGEDEAVEPEAPVGPLLGVGPLGEADDSVVGGVNTVLNAIAAADTSDTLSGTVFPQIATANGELNTLLGGDVPPGVPVAGVPLVEDGESEFGNNDGHIGPDDLPSED